MLVVGLIGLGAWHRHAQRRAAAATRRGTTRRSRPTARAEVVEVKVDRCRRSSPPAPVQIKDNIVPIEISEYAGYAGLIAANGGLDPTENSVFFKNHGFKVKLTISEDENWSELNEGKIAASVTTADVLAVYGRQLHAIVPAQIGFSRGADGVVVRNDIKRINALKGKTIATAQFTEVDFFIRYLAQEAGLAVNTLASLDATPHPERVNLVYTEDGFGAGDLFLADLKSGKNRLAGVRDVGAEGLRGRERQRRPGARAHDQPQPADRGRRADRAQRLRRAEAEDRRRARRRACSKATGWCATGRTRTSTSSAAPSSGRATETQGGAAAACISRTCRRTSRSSPARSTRPAASAASISRRCSPTAATSSRIRSDADRFVDTEAPAGDRQDRALQGAEGRDRADPHGRRGRPLETNPLLSKDIRFLFEPN